jgi:hypothetical protein
MSLGELKTYILKFETLTPLHANITTLLKAENREEAMKLSCELYLENPEYPCVSKVSLVEIGVNGRIPLEDITKYYDKR